MLPFVEVHANSKMSLKRGRGMGCGNRVIIDPQEGVLQDVPARLGRPTAALMSAKVGLEQIRPRPTQSANKVAGEGIEARTRPPRYGVGYGTV